MPKNFDVCIRGDGIVGRTLALLLARERLRVALVAQPAPTPMAEDVRAYALNGVSRGLLMQLRAWPATPAVTPVSEMRVWGDSGGRLDFTLPASSAAMPSSSAAPSEALAWIVDVPALEQQLAEALRFAPEVDYVASPEDAAAKLTVVCEGQKSSSRREFGAAWTVKPYDQKAVAARFESDRPHGGAARQWFGQGEVLGLLPVAGVGGKALALVWSVPVARADALQHMSPDQLVAAVQHVCGDEVGQLTLSGPVASWPLNLSNAERWVGPGWALAGDAAHTVHPMAGQGLNLGLADVKTLADVLKGREYWRSLGDEKLLRRYERARKADVLAMATVTDGLHGLFAHTDARWQALRNWGMTGVARSGPLKAWLTRQATG
ncbi:MAG: 2-polyprenyl-6-methoxyphenol hydroxylase-like FAD-dependent oxidoreductase [Polaromonas sp.]|jgi:2-polyprenyl-6-methoxyphenol hydroxylase-like FAD-dependent oxidoreductase